MNDKIKFRKSLGGVAMKKIKGLLCLILVFLLMACSENVIEKAPEKEYENSEITAYVESFECGYISHAEELREGRLLITTEEELNIALKYDCLNPEDDTWPNNSIASAFEKVMENYPISEYSYLIEYWETSCGGYNIHADKVEILEDNIGFSFDVKQFPSEDEMVTEAMGGFCHIAAIPKEQIEGKKFINVVYPQ